MSYLIKFSAFYSEPPMSVPSQLAHHNSSPNHKVYRIPPLPPMNPALLKRPTSSHIRIKHNLTTSLINLQTPSGPRPCQPPQLLHQPHETPRQHSPSRPHLPPCLHQVPLPRRRPRAVLSPSFPRRRRLRPPRPLPNRTIQMATPPQRVPQYLPPQLAKIHPPRRLRRAGRASACRV